jgi:anti-sigma factor RsiW
MMTVSREELAAYADGELSAEREAAVAAQIAADPALARELEAHRALKARLASHFAPIVEEPLPEALTASLRSKEAEVVISAQCASAWKPSARSPGGGGSQVQRWPLRLLWRCFCRAAGSQLLVMLTRKLAAVLDSQLVADQQPDATYAHSA